MNTIQKRFLAFLLLCIPVRIGFVVIAKKVDKKYLPYLGYLAILPAIGFAYIYISGKRKTIVAITFGMLLTQFRFISACFRIVLDAPYTKKTK